MITTRIRWSRELVLEEIKKMQQEGTPLNASYIMKTNSRLYGAARKHLGSWREAVIEAGFDYDKINLRSNEKVWDKDIIKEEIVKLAETGESLNSDYIQKNHTKLHSASQRYFKSWGDAVNYAGFDYGDIKNIKWTEETVTAHVLDLSSRGINLSSSNMQQEYMSLFQAGCRIYGSWKNAVNTSGLDYNDFRKQKEWTEESVKKEIQKFHLENGSASAGLVSKKNGALYQAARRTYAGQTWNEVVKKALT